MIGVFDSGFGGLTIFKEIIKLLPEYDYIYLGDTSRSPYGGHAFDLVHRYTVEAVDFLFKEDCQLIILACNTATAAALRRIQQEYLPAKYPDRRVLGVIRPVVEKAVHLTQNGKIGVIGTRVTVSSGAFVKELENHFVELDKVRKPRHAEHKWEPLKLEVHQQACPLLVPLIEEGWEKRPETKRILRGYLRPLKLKKIDVLLLGCTHYPILIEEIKGVMGPKVMVPNPGQIVAQSLKDYLARHPEIEQKLSKEKKIRFLTTDEMERFERLGARFFGKPVKAEKVSLI